MFKSLVLLQFILVEEIRVQIYLFFQLASSYSNAIY